MKIQGFGWFGFLVMFSFFSCSQKKINGVNLVSPPTKIEENCFTEVTKMNANWVSVIPYAFSKGYSTEVQFNSDYQWWGEKEQGVAYLINTAKKKNLKVMLKPHVWFRNGFATEFTLQNEADWVIWEKNYTNYILFHASLAQKNKVDLFCFSTELKQVVKQRPKFWTTLIAKIKQVYKGKLTYAANWDNYQNVFFWDQLDYIGIDVYFPLSDKKEPSIEELNMAWLPIKKSMAVYAKQQKKNVLFTEYGFESCDYNTKNTWGSHGKFAENEQAQVNAYTSLYTTFYDENWFLGGFLWKWHLTPTTLRSKATSFSPKHKKVMEVIDRQFKK